MNFNSEKGSAEALSAAMLFVLILGVTAGMAIAGNQVIDTAAESQTYEQNIDTMFLFDDIAKQTNEDTGQNESSRATQTLTINTYENSLETTERTTIEIGQTELHSDPFKFTNPNYEIVYDSRIIGVKSVDSEDTTIKTPTQNEFGNRETNVLPIITLTHDDFPVGVHRSRVVLLNRPSPVESQEFFGGQSITIDTQHPNMWEDYLSEQEFLGEVTQNGNTVETTFDEDTTVYHYNIVVSS